MTNNDIAHIFRTIADILEINDENFFRIRAYRRAAQNIVIWPKMSMPWLRNSVCISPGWG